MQILVTGATGLIGNAIAKKAVEAGHQVKALVRSEDRARKILPSEVTLIRGDVTTPESLPDAVRGAEIVFHAAGLPEQWQADSSIFDRVNRQGTVHVLRAAQEANVRRVLYTSTMDVFAAPQGGVLTEDNIDSYPKPTYYERSKQAAEREAEGFLGRGLDVVFLNPSAVYGPSPVHVALNSFFIQLLKRQVPLLPPGGMSVCYVDEVAKAHLAAIDKGKKGERYLLSDRYVSNAELGALIVKEAGLPRVPPTAPTLLMKGLAAVMEPLAQRFGFTPLIAKGQLSFVLWQARVDSSKAQRELGYQPFSLEEGVRRTISFLRREGLG